MRGAARGLIVALALGAAPPLPAGAADAPPYSSAIRELDGAQFLEDEPIWMCDPNWPDAFRAGAELPYRLVGREASGRQVTWGPPNVGQPVGLLSELTAWYGPDRRSELHPLGPFLNGGLRAGRYEIRPAGRDSGKVLATFRVIEPRGSELAVRAALARAARLARGEWLENPRIQELRMGPSRGQVQAAELYEAVLARYPRTSYRTAIYARLSTLFRSRGSLGTDGERWVEEIFAHFHNTCFGEWALHQYMLGRSGEEARARLLHLSGLYPSTRMSRAAARYM